MKAARGDTREHILYLLKTTGRMTAQALADDLGITAMGVRQHLKRLSDDGLVSYAEIRAGVGRPARHWSLTALCHGRFPDGHDELSVSLLETVRKVFGAKGVDKLIDARTRAQTALYRERIGARKSLRKRLERLVEQRTSEGYMAGCVEEGGAFLLTEDHCPIGAAARVCPKLCRAEMDLFRNALGEDVEVERVDHLLAGARRCAYRVARAPERSP